MTFKELKDEVERYDLGPGARVTVRDRGDGYAELGVMVPRYYANNPHRMGEQETAGIIPLDEVDQEMIRKALTCMWRELWQHEMEENLAYDGVRVFDPHPMGAG